MKLAQTYLESAGTARQSILPISPEQLGKSMLQINQQKHPDGKDVSRLRAGFILRVITEKELDQEYNKWTVKSPYGISYTRNHGNLQAIKAETAGLFTEKALSKIPDLIEKQIARVANLEKDIQELRSQIGKPWPKQERLDELKLDLKEIEATLNRSLITPNDGDKVKDQIRIILFKINLERNWLEK